MDVYFPYTAYLRSQVFSASARLNELSSVDSHVSAVICSKLYSTCRFWTANISSLSSSFFVVGTVARFLSLSLYLFLFHGIVVTTTFSWSSGTASPCRHFSGWHSSVILLICAIHSFSLSLSSNVFPVILRSTRFISLFRILSVVEVSAYLAGFPPCYKPNYWHTY